VADFQAAAKNTGSSSMPAGVQGGSFGTPQVAAASGSSGSASASPTSKSLGNMIRGDTFAGILCMVFAVFLS
jgi:hypothetical protein